MFIIQLELSSILELGLAQRASLMDYASIHGSK